MNDDILEEISNYDQDYAPSENKAFMPGAEVLADGVYVMDIIEAELTRTEKKQEPILQLTLRMPGGLTIQHAYFFRDQAAVDRLGADLCVLGFDADKWNGRHGRKFSAELSKAVGKLAGIRFQAKKRTYDGRDGKQKTALDILCLVSGPAAKPAALTPAPTHPQQPARPVNAFQPAPVEDDADPF